MAPRRSLSDPSCPPTTRSLHRGGEVTVFRQQLVVTKDGAAIRLHEIVDGANAGDRHELGKWIGAKLDLELGNKKRQVERAEAKRRIQLGRAAERADLTKTLPQHCPNLVVHDRFDLFRRARFQHVIPPSTTRICPVMKDACSDARKYTAFATSFALVSRPSGVRRTMRCLRSLVRPCTISLSK